MASMNDESLGSTQLAEIRRQLHAPEQGSPNNQSTIQESVAALTESIAPNVTQRDSIEDPDSPLPTLQRSAAARRVSGKKHANAAPLALARSSPLISHQTSVGPSGSGMRMAHSFAGFDVDGDTQPLDTQVYRQYTSSAIGIGSGVHGAGETQGSTARVDLASDWDKPEDVEDEVSIADGDVSQISPAFAVPKTPALAGRKRNIRGEILDSAARTSEPKTSSTKTPGTELSAAAFGHAEAGNLISLTQAFNQTQAPSSPLPNGPRSDPVFDRPSPDFQPPRATSPLPRTSSPTEEVRSDFSRAVTEPIEQYRTMKESQEERLRRRREEEERRRDHTSDILDDDDDLFNMPTTIEKRAQRLREHAASSVDVLDRLSSHTGRRSRPVSRSKENGRAYVSDATATSNGQEVQIPMTSSRPGLKADGVTVVRSSPLSRLGSAAQEVPATASQPEKRATSAPKATQATAIEDSQKERTESQKENDDPELPDEAFVRDDPSMSQRTNVAPSQISVVSAQTLKVLQARNKPSAAIPPVAPPAVSPSRHEEAVNDVDREMPSSPPLMTSDKRDEDEDDEVEEVLQEQPVISTVAKARSKSQDEEVAEGRADAEGITNTSDTHATRGEKSHTVEQHTTTTDTNTTSTAYQTAPSHHTPSPAKRSAMRTTTATGRTPRSTRTRKLTDIAVDPTPLPSYEQMDLDGINIMNDDDEDFTRIMSGSSPVNPSRKKRIVYSAKKRRPVAEPAQPKTPPSAKMQNEAAFQHKEVPMTGPKSPTTRSARAREQHEGAEIPKPSKAGASHRATRGLNTAGKLRRPTNQAATKGKPKAAAGLGSGDGPILPTVEDPVASSADAEDVNGDKHVGGAGVAHAQPAKDSTAAGIHAPNRVIALCHDGQLNYWPGTCTGIKSDGNLAVRFDDGTEDVVAKQHVRRFDLRPGDIIKVDLPAMKKRDYIIQGVDTTTITVSAKPSGKGAMAGKVTPATPITIPIVQIYLTGRLWPQLHSREYVHTPPAADGAPSSTPVPIQAPSAIPTPTSRSRRATTGAIKQEQQREVSTSSFKTESFLFQGMAFAVSFKDDTRYERKSTPRLLLENGAQVFDSGFEALFTVPSVATGMSGPSNDGDALQLAGNACSLGFVALITDMHSRRPKFLQALALGLPCLHHRWVSDCITAKEVLPWDKYLLPAGESAWLGGSVKSRTMPTYGPANAKFYDVINNRRLLVPAESRNGVLLVDATVESSKAIKSTARSKKPGPARGLDERRKRFVFMMYAVGANHFRRVKDVAEAKAVLRSGKAGDWAWMYVDGDTRVAETLLSGGETGEAPATASRKRKHAESEGALAVARSDVRVVNDEFIIQSLILGALAD